MFRKNKYRQRIATAFINMGIGLCLLLFSVTCCYSQYLSNPSFEGTTGMSKVPTGWTVCDTFSTPDTQPLINYENHSPTDGNTFLSLVGRTTPSPYAGHSEDCETQLLNPLLKNKCYKFRIDVACSKTMRNETWDGTFYYSNPMILKIYGETAPCAKTELLYQSEPIPDENWKTIEFFITPTTDITYLYLQSDFAQLPAYFGSLLLDNIRLSDFIMNDVVKLDTIVNYGNSLSMNASPGMQYNWSPDICLSCTDCQNPVANVLYSMTYTAFLTESTGCYNHREYFIIEIKPFIPNVMTPNGDGKNDYFKILGLVPNSVIIITNRMGEVLYESNNYDNTWDGKYRGSLLPEDTYWYILRCPTIKDDITGFIYLKR